VLRAEQGWIGGTSPLDAHLVMPPPEEVPALVDDLIAYANRDSVLTGPIVASELGLPLESANAALGNLVAAGVLVEHGTVRPSGRGRPSRLYASAELLGLTGSNPFARLITKVLSAGALPRSGLSAVFIDRCLPTLRSPP
jgi:hypothetical protein